MREHSSRLDRVRDQARLDVAPRHDDVRRVDRGLRVARLELPDVALVRLELGVDERSVVRERLLDVADRAEGLVVHLDELRRVLGQRAALGDDDGDAVTLIARLVSGERVVRRHLDVLRHRPGAGHAADPVAGEVRAGERGDDTLRSPGGVEIHAVDAGVRVRAADDRHVDGPGQRQVVDEGAASAQQGGVLLALDGRPDVGLGGFGDGHDATPAADATAFTMLWYPVQRQRFPSSPARIAASSVAAPLSIRLTAASTIPGVQ